MSQEQDLELIGDWNPDLRFELNEAIALLNHEIIRLHDRAYLPIPPTEKVGIVCGILTMNDQIEILVRFHDGIEQLCKTEFHGDYIKVE